jgi:hypothetical protein
VQRDLVNDAVVIGHYFCGQWLSRYLQALRMEFCSAKEEQASCELLEWEKAYNTELSRHRVVIEHVNARLKVFKIMSYPYHNRL